MDAVYAECRKLANEFRESEEKQIPEHHWQREDGEKYLRREVYEDLKNRTDQYYQRMLDQRSQRVPK
jgi:hypothetical protein